MCRDRLEKDENRKTLAKEMAHAETDNSALQKAKEQGRFHLLAEHLAKGQTGMETPVVAAGTPRVGVAA